MKNLLVVPLVFASACASMSAPKSAAFQGSDNVTKRRTEIANAGQGATDCMKGKAAMKGGVFAVMADANGKLKIDPISWDGPDDVKQCIVDMAAKTTITPMPGPSVGTLWEFTPPGEKPEAPKVPDDLAVKMQPLTETMQNQVIDCGQRNLGVDFPATIELSYFLYNSGHAYAPTVIGDDSKEGAFEACVQDVIMKTQFPTLAVSRPFQTSMRFKIGVYGDTQHK
jgi:hypothetical protein